MTRFPPLPFRWIAAGVASYAAFVIMTAPPSLMARLVNRAAQGRAVLSETTGTFWSGAGTLTVVGPQNRGVSVRAEWRFRPLSLVAGRVGLEVSGTGSGGSLSGLVEVGPHSVSFRHFSAVLPAAWAALFDFPMPAGDPDGQLRIESPSFYVGRSGASGAALITWQNAGTAQTGSLGSYRLSVTGRGPNADLLLETISSGALAADGRGAWTLKTGEARMDGTLAPRASGGALEPLLQFVGPDIGGQRAFSISGRMPLAF